MDNLLQNLIQVSTLMNNNKNKKRTLHYMLLKYLICIINSMICNYKITIHLTYHLERLKK